MGIGTTIPGGILTAVGGNVGIGTWKPQALFDVSTGGATPLFLGTMAPESEYVQNDLEVDGTAYLTDAIIGSLTVTAGITSTGGSTFDHIEVTGEAVFNTLSGNVGIGTTMTGAIGTKFAVIGGNVGIGTTSAQGGFVVTNGNVGIGTWAPADTFQVGKYSSGSSGFEIDSNGNVGIGTTITSNAGLSVMSGGIGIGTWVTGVPYNLNVVSLPNADTASFTRQTTNGASPWQIGNIHLALTGSVGIGLGNGLIWDLPDSAGNVDHAGMISSYWVNNISGSAQSAMAFNLYVPGGAQYSSAAMTIFPGGGNGYVGIGTWSPAKPLSVNGDTYHNGNIGIGTTFVGGAGEGALTVMNGNVGIGTWVPALPFSVSGNSYFNGNVGIGTTTPQTGLAVISTNVGIGTWTANSALQVVGNVGIGSVIPYGSLDVGPSGTICFGNSCKTSWAGANNYWSLIGGTGNVGVSTTNTVGIGTTSGVGAGLVVMNGNVGIGTWAPSDIFQVGKFSSSSSGFEVDSNGNVGIGTTLTSTAAISVMNGNVGIGTWVPVSSMEVVGVGTVIPGSGLSVMNGNVGIGTTAPSAMLHVYRNNPLTNNNPVAIFENDSNQAYPFPGILFNTNRADGGAFINAEMAGVTQTIASFNGQSQFFSFGGAVGPLIILTNGNVGIGTTMPQGALSVMSGNVGIGTWKPQALFDVSTGGATPLFLGTMAPESEYVQNDLEVDGTAYLTDAIIGALTVTQGLTLTGGSTFDHIEVTGEAVFNTQSGNVGIGTTMTGASAGTQLAVMKGNVGIGTITAAGGLVVMNGNVGIGTWVPAGALDIKTGNNVLVESGKVGIGTTLPSSGLSVGSNGVSIGANYTNGTSAPSNGLAVQGNVGIGTTVPQGAFVVTNGNVGIGTWAPVNALAIVGGASIGSTTYANAVAPTNGLIVSGNVGIGTMLPSSGLSVGANGVSIGANYTNGPSAPANGLAVQGNIGIGTTTPQTGLAVVSTNVGIGTWTASSALQVVGNVGIGSTLPNGSLDVGPSGTICFGSSCKTSWNGANNYWSLAGGTGNVGINTTNTVGIGTTSGVGAGLVVMNGNVGIGTWVPANALDVVGGNIGIGTAFNIMAGGNTILTLRTDTTSIYAGYQAGASTTVGSL